MLRAIEALPITFGSRQKSSVPPHGPSNLVADLRPELLGENCQRLSAPLAPVPVTLRDSAARTPAHEVSHSGFLTQQSEPFVT